MKEGFEISGMSIDQQRLARDITELGEIGLGHDGSVSRLAFTPADLEGRRFFERRAREAGLRVYHDHAGNIFARLEAGHQGTSSPVIMAGSHIDTVPAGGRFDGVLGVFAALECARVLQENSVQLRFPLEVCVFAAEEACHLGGTFGSRAVSGHLNLDDLPDDFLLNADRLREDFHLDLEKIGTARRHPGEIKAYLELHVEQGSVLETLSRPIGIVAGIQGACRYRVTSIGEANHSGATPMHLRKDALVPAARVVLAVEELCVAASPSMVGTVGQLNVEPNAVNVIPGKVTFSVELRAVEARHLTQVRDQLFALADRTGEFHFERLVWKEPVIFDGQVLDAVEESCQRLGVTGHRMISAAGHDAGPMASIAPTAMIFVPSIGGISHSREERTNWQDAALGAEVLLETMLQVNET